MDSIDLMEVTIRNEIARNMTHSSYNARKSLHALKDLMHKHSRWQEQQRAALAEENKRLIEENKRLKQENHQLLKWKQSVTISEKLFRQMRHSSHCSDDHQQSDPNETKTNDSEYSSDATYRYDAERDANEMSKSNQESNECHQQLIRFEESRTGNMSDFIMECFENARAPRSPSLNLSDQSAQIYPPANNASDDSDECKWAPVPCNYICFHCGLHGHHWIMDCPRSHAIDEPKLPNWEPQRHRGRCQSPSGTVSIVIHTTVQKHSILSHRLCF